MKTQLGAARVTGVALLSLLALPTLASAQQTPAPGGVEEITVTARKRAEDIQDVPFAISAQTEEQLRATGSRNVEDIALGLPSFSVQNLGPGQSQVAIRGISAGQIVRDQPGVKEQVGIYLDESVISLSLFTPDLDLFDLNRVEVLRGPQGTLFGSGSVSGTVRYITNQPNLSEMETTLEAGLSAVDGGGFGREFKGAVSVPLVEDVLAARFVAYKTYFPGFIDGVGPGGTEDSDVNDGERQGIRFSLLFQPSDTVRLTPRVIYQEVETDGFNRFDRFNIFANAFNTGPGTLGQNLGRREQFRQLQETFDDEFFLGDLTAEWDITDQLTVTSVSSYTQRDILQVRDATQLTGSITGQDGVFVPGGFPASVFTLNAPLDDDTTVDVFTQELRFAGDAQILNGFSWVFGGFYSEIDRDYGQSLLVSGFEAQTAAAGTPIPTEGPRAATDVLFFSDISFDFEQYALFTEGTLRLDDRFEVTAGLRYFDFEEDRILDFDGLFTVPTLADQADTDSDGLNPRLILGFSPNENSKLTLQVSRGFRLGGVNDPLNAPVCNAQDLATFSGNPIFDDEEVTNYEAGAKFGLAEGTITVSAAAYYTDIKDLQANFDAGSCSSRVVLNIPDARSQGVELEVSATPIENLDFGISGSVNNAELRSTLTTADGSILQGAESGHRLPTVPRFQMAAAANYTQPQLFNEMDGFLSATFQHVGDRVTRIEDTAEATLNPVALITTVGNPTVSSLTFDPELSSYNLVNLRTGVRNERWEISFFINNLFDERAELALDRERGGRGRVGVLTNQPRTFGIQTRVTF
jgi:iron complex outermembrane recepter protein